MLRCRLLFADDMKVAFNCNSLLPGNYMLRGSKTHFSVDGTIYDLLATLLKNMNTKIIILMTTLQSAPT